MFYHSVLWWWYLNSVQNLNKLISPLNPLNGFVKDEAALGSKCQTLTLMLTLSLESQCTTNELPFVIR